MCLCVGVRFQMFNEFNLYHSKVEFLCFMLMYYLRTEIDHFIDMTIFS